MSDNVLELVLAETNQRLDRIEAALGINERTEAGAALDALLERQGLIVNDRLTMDESAMSPPETEPHPFVGRLDRWCEVCDRPDRNPIHTPTADDPRAAVGTGEGE